MKTNLVKITLVLSAVSALVACNQNPYPTNLIADPSEQSKHVVATPYTVEGPKTASCEEGKECKITLVGHVPAPMTATLTFTNLPAGATYNNATNVLSYTPSFDVVDVSSDASHTSKDLPLIGIVIGDGKTFTTGSSSLQLTVNNTLRPMVLSYVSGPVQVNEGQAMDQVIGVTSPDFPNGPFFLSLDGAPAGTTVTSVSGTPGLFKVHYQPDNSAVTVADTVSGTTFVKKFSVKYNAFALLGSQSTIAKDWTVMDQRLAPLITAPDAISQGLNVNFAIRADDLNFEIAPVITVDATNVPFGHLTVTPVVQTSSVGVSPYTSVVNVQWDQLSAANLGTTTPIFFVVCVQSAKAQNTFCTAKKTLVTLSATASAATITEL